MHTGEKTLGELTWLFPKGTFARVCLVRLANPKNEAERTRVFALKILRKTEGSCNLNTCLGSDSPSAATSRD